MTATTAPAANPPRSRHTARNAALAVGVVLALFVGVLATREPAQNTVAVTQLAGKQAPPIEAETVQGGEQVRLADFRGQYVLVNFFASWCIPCQREHDELIRFTERHDARGDAKVLAVVFSDEPANAKAFFERRGGDWPVVVDPQGQVALDYGVRGPPESFLVDRDGFVLTRIVGEVTDDGLEQLLAEARRRQG